MSVDFYAVAQAIATRFSSAVVTAPAGETNVQQSTAALPDVISDEPTVLVFPPDVHFSFGPSSRKGVVIYPVRLYLYKVRDMPRNVALMNNWITQTYGVLDGQVHLGLSSYVDYARVTDVVVGPLEYAGVEYHGVELTVEVHVSEGLTLTAGA